MSLYFYRDGGDQNSDVPDKLTITYGRRIQANEEASLLIITCNRIRQHEVREDI